MKRWAQLWLAIAGLAPAAHAAEVELEIALPEPQWLLPPTSSPQLRRQGQPGRDFPVLGTELPPVLEVESVATVSTRISIANSGPEGITTLGEQQLVLDLRPLIDAGDYAAVLARVRMSYSAELALLEAGDGEGFFRMRMPTDGRPQIFLTGNTFADQRGMGVPPNYVSATMLYVIGHSYFSLEQYLPAETAFKLALRPLPNHIRVHESLGMLYLRTERYAQAREHLARALQLGRNTAHVNTALGYLDQKARRYWAAANAFQRALVLEPDNKNAQRGLLHALTETREHAKARALVEQLLRDEPDDPSLWLYRAHIALAADERAVAVASLEAALRLGDRSLANRRTCAALHMESGNIARAVELLRGSSARGLAFPLVDQALGWLANEDEWDYFRTLSGSVDRSALGGVEQSRLLTRRASLALHDGNRRAASTALQEALALDPSNADALIALGQIHRAERDYGRADLLFQRASAYGLVRENALVARAQVAIDEEDFDGALVILRNVVTGNAARADLGRNIDLLENLVLLRTQR